MSRQIGRSSAKGHPGLLGKDSQSHLEHHFAKVMTWVGWIDGNQRGMFVLNFVLLGILIEAMMTL